MEQQSSAAQAFFLAHKDLFQYEKHVGNGDPFQSENNNRAEQSFLEQYREIDREQPAVSSALSDLRFSLLRPPARRFSIPNFEGNTPASIPMPGFVTLTATSSVLEGFNNLQHERSHPLALENSPQRMNAYKQSPSSASKVVNSTPEPQYPSPARSPSPPRSSVGVLMQKSFILPNLSELLIDPETRAAATAHKSWDEAHKIEVLVGGKCVGRMSAASRNIPPSIRSRLRASAKVSVRRERLYDLLRSEHEELSRRCTQ